MGWTCVCVVDKKERVAKKVILIDSSDERSVKAVKRVLSAIIPIIEPESFSIQVTELSDEKASLLRSGIADRLIDESEITNNDAEFLKSMNIKWS